MVTLERIEVAGGTAWRVSRIFPNAASAECASRLLEQVNPAGFEPCGMVEPPKPPVLVVDEDEIPGCRSGVCED